MMFGYHPIGTKSHHFKLGDIMNILTKIKDAIWPTSELVLTKEIKPKKAKKKSTKKKTTKKKKKKTSKK